MRFIAILSALPLLALASPIEVRNTDEVEGCPAPPHHTTTTTSVKPTTTAKPTHTSTSTKTSSTSTSSTSATAAPTNGPFTLMSVRSASPVHLQQINANGGFFWIGKSTSTYCPSGVSGLDCTQFTNSTTALEVGEPLVATSGAMYTTVPGGQELFVQANGALGFTQAHSANVPAGAYTSGFIYDPAAAGASYGEFGFTAGGASGFMACPTTAAGFPYQVFATVAAANSTGCIGFDTFAIPYSGEPAWQYV